MEVGLGYGAHRQMVLIVATNSWRQTTAAGRAGVGGKLLLLAVSLRDKNPRHDGRTQEINGTVTLLCGSAKRPA
jgi:hypothetical protein